jgi:hypothetical protein
MPVTRAQNAEMLNAAATLVTLKYSKATGGKSVSKVDARPMRRAAIVARQLIKLCASSDNEDYSQ